MVDMFADAKIANEAAYAVYGRPKPPMHRLMRFAIVAFLIVRKEVRHGQLFGQSENCVDRFARMLFDRWQPKHILDKDRR
jgi:hypothetical protein